jgi:predicted ATPase
MSQSNLERQMIETHVPPHNLPAQLTAFIGREAESAQVIGLLRNPDCRLVSVIGAGGVGKTRLALEVAHALAHDPVSLFPDGIFAVPLAALTAGEPLDEMLATAIAGALSLTFSGPEAPVAQVRNYLRLRTLLLLLDNVEHLSAGTPFLVALLHGAPGLKLLVTSRERLHVRGEWLVALDGLAYPDDRRPTSNTTADKETQRQGDKQQAGLSVSVSPDLRVSSVVDLERYGAIRLFVQTARMHAPDFALSAEVASAVVGICRLVAGLPLGIELAASWTRLLPCAEIASEIAQNLDFLADAAPDLPARQQSLRAVFDYSWGLLAPSEQQTLRQLAIFRGSFTREAATSVVELRSEKDVVEAPPITLNSPFSILNLLAALVDKSLVRRIVVGVGARYELLELLRQYAAEHLERAGEADGIAARHAAYYSELLAARTVDLRGAGQQAALLTIGAEMIRSARPGNLPLGPPTWSRSSARPMGCSTSTTCAAGLARARRRLRPRARRSSRARPIGQ